MTESLLAKLAWCFSPHDRLNHARRILSSRRFSLRVDCGCVWALHSHAYILVLLEVVDIGIVHILGEKERKEVDIEYRWR